MKTDLNNIYNIKTYIDMNWGTTINKAIDIIQKFHPSCTCFNGTLIHSNPDKTTLEIFEEFCKDRNK